MCVCVYGIVPGLPDIESVRARVIVNNILGMVGCSFATRSFDCKTVGLTDTVNARQAVLIHTAVFLLIMLVVFYRYFIR